MKNMKKNKKLSEKMYKKLTKIRFSTGGKEYEVDFSDELIIGELKNDIERLSAVIGYLGTVITLLEQEYKNKEDLKKVVEAKLDHKMREAGMTGETRILRAIQRHNRWVEACVEINEAKAKLERAKNIHYALRVKGLSMNSRSNDIRSSSGDKVMELLYGDIMRIERKS